MHRRRGTAYQLLKLVEEGGEIGFWWMDLSTGDMAGSLGLLQITGLTSEADANTIFGRLIHPADRAAQADVVDVLRRGHPLARTFRIIRADRTVRWVRIKGQAVLGADELPVRAEGVILDVTAPQEAMSLAAENQARYLAFTRAIAAVEWTATPSGQHRFAYGWQTLTGQPLSDAHGDGWQQALHPDDRSRAADAWRTAWTHRTAYDTDFRVRCADGCYRWYNSRAAPLMDDGGSVREWFGIILEIAGSTRFATGQASEAAVELTPELVRAARAMMTWSVASLADRARVSVSSIKRLEAQGRVRRSTLHAIRAAFEENHLRFHSNGDGEVGILAAFGRPS